MTGNQHNLGLSSAEAKARLQQYGRNELTSQKKQSFLLKAFHIICEPMFLLLIAAAVIYFLLGEPRDGAIMLVFVVGIISIDIIQEWKTDKTLNALRELSAPHAKVIRDGTEKLIPSAELVPGDVMLIAEGVKIPADGIVIKANDLCVDESSLTGESEGVWKNAAAETPDESGYWKTYRCYAGTLVTQGSGYIQVDATGVSTEYGRIGKSVAEASDTPSPLTVKTGKLVKLCAAIAAVLFVTVGVITYLNITEPRFIDRVVKGILSGITLAMAMIPEEFPVILTVFLSMGAWRLAKKHSLVRKLPAVETLGAVSVLCVDKTGTITMNRMRVRETWANGCPEEELTETMGLACETDAYDPMEHAMLEYCEENSISKGHLFAGRLLQEYSFTNELKMMGHVWHHDGEIIIAAKGSPERLLPLCELTDGAAAEAEARMDEMSRHGLRVIAVARLRLADESEIPSHIMDCTFELMGLVGLADPPRESVKADIAACLKAGVRVVMITGDNGVTAGSIAGQVGIPNAGRAITGQELDAMSDEELQERVKEVNVFARVVPEHKMRIVKAFQANGHVVAMTGDGVNDAPALKYADIGIAMGKRGSEVSREAADLILMDDNFSTIVDTIRDGRRIYDNIQKAVGYVFTIHIPIALSSLIAPMLGIAPANLLLLPLHVVLLELIIDPTCSIVLERQPAERDIMDRPPRSIAENIISAKRLFKSILQGLTIFFASFGAYCAMQPNLPGHAGTARAMGLAVIMLANLFLVEVNSSDKDFACVSLVRLLRDKVMWAVNIFTLVGLAVILYTPLSGFLKLSPLSFPQLMTALGIAAASVLWFELVKLANKCVRRKNHKN